VKDAPVDPVEAVRAYVARINAGDAAGLAALATADHRFVDATGVAHPGGLGREGWEGYFASFPDYRIEVEETFASGAAVAVFGWASGSRAGAAWRFPAAWRAVVREGRLHEWRVYADVEPMLRSLGRRRFE
jgi:ketosteroid isomerase-like protein